jgi:hypothetical protein
VLETSEVKAVVIVGKEDGLVIIASLDDVLRDAWERIARLPGHEPSPGECDGGCRYMVTFTRYHETFKNTSLNPNFLFSCALR